MLRYWVETGNILIGKLTPQLAKATNQTWKEQQEQRQEREPMNKGDTNPTSLKQGAWEAARINSN